MLSPQGGNRKKKGADFIDCGKQKAHQRTYYVHSACRRVPYGCRGRKSIAGRQGDLFQCGGRCVLHKSAE